MCILGTKCKGPKSQTSMLKAHNPHSLHAHAHTHSPTPPSPEHTRTYAYTTHPYTRHAHTCTYTHAHSTNSCPCSHAHTRANEYIDFADLPPAKGKSRPLPQSLEGHIIVVQAADLAQPRRVIPDLATWSQCFALYVTVLAPSQPRLADLMAYQSLIAKVSAKFKWPSWVVYDENFQQDAVGNPQLAWAKVDPSTYAQCFTNQVISRKNWCEKCQSLDHTSGNCPSRPRKRPWSAITPQVQPGSNDDICKKYNRFNGDCKFGKECRYLHICLKCREPHPISRCKANSAGSSSAGSSSRSPA